MFLQFFVDRIEHLVQCKHMHMLRWARFCEHTKAIENLYPIYQKRLRYGEMWILYVNNSLKLQTPSCFQARIQDFEMGGEFL